MDVQKLNVSDLATRLFLVHPPEPRPDSLVSSVNEGIYIGKTRWLNVPVFWNFKKLINPHIAIVGITGSGKSIERNEPVVIRQNGKVSITKIGELVDGLIRNAHAPEKIEDVEGISTPGIEVYSFDDKLKAKWVPVNFAGRKKSPASMYSFTTASGRKIKTTGDHNVVVLRDGGISVAKGSEVRPGDYLPAPRELSFEGEEFAIDALELLKRDDVHVAGAANVIKDNYSKLLKCLPINRKYDKYLRFYKCGRAIPIAYFSQIMGLLGLDAHMIPGLVLRPRNGLAKLSPKIEKEKATALARLCGYIVSEGAITKHFISVHTTEPELLADMKNCFDVAGFPSFTIPHGIRTSASAVVRLLRRIGIEGKAGSKKIPPLIMASRPGYLAEFLKGYFEGDGGVEQNCVSATTKSKELASQLCYMLLRFGIIARVHPHWTRATNSRHKGDTYYRISISGKGNIQKYTENIGFVTQRKNHNLVLLLQRCGKGHSNVDIIPNIGDALATVMERYSIPRTQMTYSIQAGLRRPTKKYLSELLEQVSAQACEDKEVEFLNLLAQSDLFWDPITEKTEAPSEDEFVYDLSVDNEVFMAGFGGLFVHNSYLVKTFLTRASLIWNSNAIILDWVGEYDKWVKQAGGTVLHLGTEHLNLMDLAGLTPSERTKQIMSALEILLDLHNFPSERNDIEEAIEDTYAGVKNPTLSNVVDMLDKGRKKSAARLLKHFTTQGSDFFAKPSTLAMEKLTNSGLMCIDLHSLPTEEMRSLAGLTILQFLKEKMRREEMKEEKGVRLFVVVDEAWKIASDERSDVITIVREGRKYNFALIVASQNPTDMHKTIFSNVGTMFILRLILREFKDYVRQSLSYSDYIDSEISKFGVGDAALNMIFAKRSSGSHTFLLNKIDGEEPLFIYALEVDGMSVEKEREQFCNMLYELGLTDEQIGLVKNEFERSDGTMDATAFVSLLEKFGYSPSSIMGFLRQLEVDEKDIVEIFSLARRRKATKGLVDLTLTED